MRVASCVSQYLLPAMELIDALRPEMSKASAARLRKHLPEHNAEPVPDDGGLGVGHENRDLFGLE